MQAADAGPSWCNSTIVLDHYDIVISGGAISNCLGMATLLSCGRKRLADLTKKITKLFVEQPLASPGSARYISLQHYTSLHFTTLHYITLHLNYMRPSSQNVKALLILNKFTECLVQFEFTWLWQLTELSFITINSLYGALSAQIVWRSVTYFIFFFLSKIVSRKKLPRSNLIYKKPCVHSGSNWDLRILLYAQNLVRLLKSVCASYARDQNI